MYQTEIRNIEKYIDTYLYDLPGHWSKYHVNERRYARWAAEELLCKFLDLELNSEVIYNEYKNPLGVVNSFIDMLDNMYSLECTHKSNSFLFCSARQAIRDLKFTVFGEES